MTARDAFAAYRARLDALGFRPSSSLGQNFLLDPSLHQWIAERSGATPADTVLEVGCGLGFLTRELAARAGAVVAVEIDGRLLQLAQQDLVACTNVSWVHGDALGGPGHTLHPAFAAAAQGARERGGSWQLVANLPYAVSGPLLAELATGFELPARAVLLVQKEMAQRVAAPCPSPDYGGLSALVQSVFTARLLRDVPPQVFRPRPKVMSAVLELVRREDSALVAAPAAARRAFGTFVRQLFRQRRKALRTTLSAAVAAVGGTLPALPAEQLGRRAETIPPDTLVDWWGRCGGMQTGQPDRAGP